MQYFQLKHVLVDLQIHLIKLFLSYETLQYFIDFYAVSRISHSTYRNGSD